MCLFNTYLFLDSLVCGLVSYIRNREFYKRLRRHVSSIKHFVVKLISGIKSQTYVPVSKIGVIHEIKIKEI